MADDTQPGHQPGQQPAPGAPGPWSARDDAPTEWIQTSQPPPADDGSGTGDGGVPTTGGAGSGGRKRRWIAPVAAVAAVVLIGGGAFAAYTVLSGGGPQPAEAIPSSAMAYARIDLDPSADQKINMVRLLRNVPEFEEQTGITADTDDLRKRLFEKALEDSEGCSDLDYDDDIGPWIGDRAAVAAMPSDDEGGQPEPLLALQVSDEDAARDGIQALIDCSAQGDGSDDIQGIAFVGDYALLASSQDKADAYADDAESESLAESDAFSADMEALDGEGVASFWVDLDAVMSFAESSDLSSAAELKALGYDELGSVSGALRAESDAIEFVVAGDGDVMHLLGTAAEPVRDVQQLPDTTMMAFGFTGGGDAVDSLWQKLGDLAESQGSVGPGGIDELADQIEAGYGIVLPDDLAVLLGDELTVALDSEGLSFDPATGGPDPATINVGARMRTDPDAVRDLIGRIQDLAATITGASFEISDADYDGGIVVASNDDYAQTLADGGDLGGSDVFESAVADPDSAVSVLFLDLDKVSEVVDRIGEETGDPLPDQEAGTLAVLKAFGASTVLEGDYTRTTLRLVFD